MNHTGNTEVCQKNMEPHPGPQTSSGSDGKSVSSIGITMLKAEEAAAAISAGSTKGCVSSRTPATARGAAGKGTKPGKADLSSNMWAAIFSETCDCKFSPADPIVLYYDTCLHIHEDLKPTGFSLTNSLDMALTNQRCVHVFANSFCYVMWFHAVELHNINEAAWGHFACRALLHYGWDPTQPLSQPFRGGADASAVGAGVGVADASFLSIPWASSSQVPTCYLPKKRPHKQFDCFALFNDLLECRDMESQRL